MRNFVVAFALTFLALSTFAAEQKKPAEVLFLGTFHFDNPGLDYVKSEVPDVTTPERQKEIAKVVGQMRAFAPTKIVLEWPADRQADLDKRYAAYREGKYELGLNEMYQIGFRLAKMLGHERVYASDVRADMDMDAVIAFAQQHDPAFMAAFGEFMQNDLARIKKMQKEAPIDETLRAMNDPAWQALGHSKYIQMGTVGGNGNYVGSEVFGVWYTRNVKIFSNIVRLAGPGDRILAIYGESHVPVLLELARQMPGMKVLEARSYLK
ncbi:MAG TPA: DUF5694 domain-containing protein [Thermoanaerobaculia bacterium]|jgi:hypothetical protein